MQAETRGAGIEDTADAIRAALVEHAMTGARPACRATRCLIQLVDDQLDQPPERGGVQRALHQPRSSRAIFASRPMYLASRIGVSMNRAAMRAASSLDTRVDPNVRTLAPLCSRA
jgi:hypothetical protein